jgi:hypothetical protein
MHHSLYILVSTMKTYLNSIVGRNRTKNGAIEPGQTTIQLPISELVPGQPLQAMQQPGNQAITAQDLMISSTPGPGLTSPNSLTTRGVAPRGGSKERGQGKDLFTTNSIFPNTFTGVSITENFDPIYF